MAHDTFVRSHLASTSNDEQLVGRRVEIAHARVGPMAGGNGFWISEPATSTSSCSRATQMQAEIAPGQHVSITGVVLQLPSGMKDRIGDRMADEDIYVYASQIEQAKAQQK
jgi:hypothetical protein